MSGIFPSFKKGIWKILFVYTVSLFGTGMSDPYLILYLHHLRGFSFAMAGLIIGIGGVAGTVATPISGLLSDRFGVKPVFLAALVMSALGRIFYAGAFHEEWAIFASLLSGAGAAAAWNALSIILIHAVDQSQKVELFGVAFALQNAGFGLGSALSGFFFQRHGLALFQFIFLLDAATYVCFAFFSNRVIRKWQYPPMPVKRRKINHCSSLHRVMGRQKALFILSCSYLAISTAMTGMAGTLFPQWVTDQAHVSVSVVGQALLANSLVIVIGQWLVLKLVKNLRETIALAASMLLFAGGYSLIFIAGFINVSAGALILIGSFAITAVGETLLFSSLPALANELAARNVQGRYNSAINTAWQMGAIIGPIIAGFMIDRHHSALLLLLFIITLVVLAPIFLCMERYVHRG
ncbi:MFS transporter [Sporolactobacillus sp. CPB3-1]|uniref:MFS transporter n=1 Tax=Sporolactobacillus mangiferae TaxID=2940498 RepID=A0ABT0MC96_9BACL|nr:MFS transporter [Sporolactobacillus mangiferae]MCL1631960.1 MFS transporter [Sporolactobacillus mangiferae]